MAFKWSYSIGPHVDGDGPALRRQSVLWEKNAFPDQLRAAVIDVVTLIMLSEMVSFFGL